MTEDPRTRFDRDSLDLDYLEANARSALDNSTSAGARALARDVLSLLVLLGKSRERELKQRKRAQDEEDRAEKYRRNGEQIAASLLSRAEQAEARLRAAREREKRAWEDLRGPLADIIALEPHLQEPYPDDPRWTPWTRFAERALRRIEDVRGALVQS